MKKGYMQVITTKSVKADGVMHPPGKVLEVKSKTGKQLIDNDAAERFIEVKPANDEDTDNKDKDQV